MEAISDALRFEVKGFGVRVSIIQPGLIRTNFGEAAATAVGEAEAEGPYGAFNAPSRWRRRTSTSRAPRATSAAGPRRWPRRSSARSPRSRPKIRYRVTPSAHVLIGQRALMTDGMWDRFVGTQFPRPGAQ